MPPAAQLVGQVFGRLTVIAEAGTKTFPSGTSRRLWKVRCECGVEKVMSTANLLPTNGTRSCGCLQRERASQANRRFASNPAMRKLLDGYRHSARLRGHENQLTVEIAEPLFTGACHYCGAAPSRIATEQDGRYTFVYNGIDRLDNNVGYVVGNMVSCCKTCNYAKNTSELAVFVAWVDRTFHHMKSIGLISEEGVQ